MLADICRVQCVSVYVCARVCGSVCSKNVLVRTPFRRRNCSRPPTSPRHTTTRTAQRNGIVVDNRTHCTYFCLNRFVLDLPFFHAPLPVEHTHTHTQLVKVRTKKIDKYMYLHIRWTTFATANVSTLNQSLGLAYNRRVCLNTNALKIL